MGTVLGAVSETPWGLSVVLTLLSRFKRGGGAEATAGGEGKGGSGTGNGGDGTGWHFTQRAVSCLGDPGPRPQTRPAFVPSPLLEPLGAGAWVQMGGAPVGTRGWGSREQEWGCQRRKIY